MDNVAGQGQFGHDLKANRRRLLTEKLALQHVAWEGTRNCDGNNGRFRRIHEESMALFSA